MLYNTCYQQFLRSSDRLADNRLEMAGGEAPVRMVRSLRKICLSKLVCSLFRMCADHMPFIHPACGRRRRLFIRSQVAFGRLPDPDPVTIRIFWVRFPIACLAQAMRVIAPVCSHKVQLHAFVS